MLANDTALLSEYERYAYKFNIGVNLTGGIRNCIPNDHLVENHVHKVKELMRAMGANIKYSATRKAAKCLSVVSEMTSKLSDKKSGTHSEAKTATYVIQAAKALVSDQLLNRIPGREHKTFPNFCADLLKDINLVELAKWLNTQKERAHLEMVVH